MRRVAALMPHPDDEIFVAALLATAARAGAAIHLVCATRGEAGAAPPDVGPKQLAAIRTRELGAACAVLGAPPPIVLDLPDGGLMELGAKEVAATAAAALAPLSPDTLVSFGDDGGYGHRDHVAVAAAARLAARRLDPAPRLLAAAFPRGLMASIHRRLRRLRPSPIDPRLSARDLGIDRDRADVIVDARDAAEAKRAVAACHRSQLRPDLPGEFLVPGLLDALCREEWYTIAAEPPASRA